MLIIHHFAGTQQHRTGEGAVAAAGATICCHSQRDGIVPGQDAM